MKIKVLCLTVTLFLLASSTMYSQIQNHSSTKRAPADIFQLSVDANQSEGQLGISVYDTSSTASSATVYFNNIDHLFQMGINGSNHILDPNAAFLFNTGDLMKFGTNNTERMRLDQFGNLGIGTETPVFRLDVRGTNPDDGGILTLGNSDNSNRLLFFPGRSGDPNPFIQWNESNPFRFATDEGGFRELMRIQPTGIVGINNTDPDSSAILDIQSTDKGILIPRMNTAERLAIVAPANGLLAYDTQSSSFWYYNNGMWNEIASVSKAADGGNNNPADTIPDNDPTGLMDTITLTDAGVIDANTHFNVCIDVSHTWNADLDISLIAPDGTSIDLSSDNGSDSDNYTNTCFTSSAVNSIIGGFGPFSGDWTPEQPFSNFIGKNIAGDWILKLSDDVSGDEGILNWWSIEITQQAPAIAGSLSDKDGDTKIQVEESPDEDIIRFDVAGNAALEITSLGDLSMQGDLFMGSSLELNNEWDLFSNSTTFNISETNVSTRLTILPGGDVGIGNTSPIEKLHVNGNIRVADDADIFGLDQLVGFNDLRFSGDNVDGPDIVIAADGRIGYGATNPYSNGTHYFKGRGTDFPLQVDQSDGSPIFRVDSDGNAGFPNIYSNSRLTVKSKSTDDAIFRAEKSDGTMVLQANESGSVNVSGTLSKGGGSFKIDHPLDPENKYLYHSFVESPEMMNVYNGNITTDGSGYAEVELPEYFMALNRDFRYQLTVMGTFAQAIIKEKISNNRFVIQTDQPNVEVSWQVTGVRQDPFANANRIPYEEDKVAEDKGKYLHPAAYGQPASRAIGNRSSETDALNK
jgi:subtilisin-like proprotein convertase family protein